MTERAAAPASSPMWTGVAAGVAAAALWAGGSVVSRHLSLAGMSPADLTLLRYAGCFPIALCVWLWWPAARSRIPTRRLAILLLLAGPPYQALLLIGYGHASAGAGALVVTGLMPLAACILVARLAPSPPPRAAWAGALIAVAGVWIFARGLATADLDATGAGVFAAAAVMWAWLAHLVRAWRIDPLQLTVALGLWAPIFLPVWWLASADGLSQISWSALVLQAAYHGAAIAFLATFLFFLAVRRLGPEPAGCLQAVTPGLAALFGAIALGEPLGPAQVTGALVCMMGLVIGVDGERLARQVAAMRGRTAGWSAIERRIPQRPSWPTAVDQAPRPG